MERTATTIGVEGRETRRMGCGNCERRRVWEDYVRLGTLVVTWTTRVPTMRVASWVVALFKDAMRRVWAAGTSTERLHTRSMPRAGERAYRTVNFNRGWDIRQLAYISYNTALPLLSWPPFTCQRSGQTSFLDNYDTLLGGHQECEI